MATAPTNYDKIIFRFFVLANILGIIIIITKYYRFINFRLIVTKSDRGNVWILISKHSKKYDLWVSMERITLDSFGAKWVTFDS